MSPLIAPKQKSTFTPAPAGTHIARCIRLIHIGTTMGEYMGQPQEQNKIRLSFELPEEKKVWKEGEEAKPFVTDQEYTLSMGEKANLRKLVEGMIGTTLHDGEANSFDLNQIVGMPCLITIKHKTSKAGNVRAEIAHASPLMKSQVCPPAFNPTVILTYEDWNQAVFDKLPDFLKEKMASSNEYKKKFGGMSEVFPSEAYPGGEKINTDDIPF